jgi:hypothetical protein
MSGPFCVVMRNAEKPRFQGRKSVFFEEGISVFPDFQEY